MQPEERKLLSGLFERIKAAAASPRDKEAEAFINEQIRAQPAAPYLLAQTVIVQDHALQGANQRIGQLEARLKELEATAQQGAGSSPAAWLAGAPPWGLHLLHPRRDRLRRQVLTSPKEDLGGPSAAMRRLPLTRHKAAMRRHRSPPPPPVAAF